MAPQYKKAWDNIHIVAGYDKTFDAQAAKVLAGMDEYSDVYDITHVPPVVVGLMHKMESDCNFNTHLHNGDPLAKKTFHVPAGRPPVWPPNAPRAQWWEISAEDAMVYQGFDKIQDWDIARIAYVLEKYNGWGYYYHGVPSAYLWSFSNQYRGGKYISDGVWSSTTWSSQIGAMTLLKWMLAVDPSLQIIPGTTKPAVVIPAPTPPLVTAGGDLASNGCPTCAQMPHQPEPGLYLPSVPAVVPADAVEPDTASIFDHNYFTKKIWGALT